jgi:hypothetical protein
VISPIFVPAWPALLRQGLPIWAVSVFGIPSHRYLVLSWQTNTVDVVGAGEARDIVRGYPIDELRLDLRDSDVRDAAARALWRKLHPAKLVDDGEPTDDDCGPCMAPSVEPELLTAPTWRYPWTTGGWHPTTPGLRPRWTLGDIGFDARTFEAQHPDDLAQHVIPALASVDLVSPDRDLLALACVLATVFG